VTSSAPPRDGEGDGRDDPNGDHPDRRLRHVHSFSSRSDLALPTADPPLPSGAAVGRCVLSSSRSLCRTAGCGTGRARSGPG
jgi:hypothetical protein